MCWLLGGKTAQCYPVDDNNSGGRPEHGNEDTEHRAVALVLCDVAGNNREEHASQGTCGGKVPEQCTLGTSGDNLGKNSNHSGVTDRVSDGVKEEDRGSEARLGGGGEGGARSEAMSGRLLVIGRAKRVLKKV